jgi:predicted ATP-grasp superfamily ATP-dependent carboligase
MRSPAAAIAAVKQGTFLSDQPKNCQTRPPDLSRPATTGPSSPHFMRILLYEHFCSGGLAGQALDAGLLADGAGMLRSLAEDFDAAGHDVTAVLDERVPFQLPGRTVAVDAESPESARKAFDHALATVEAALIIAPEFDDLLPATLERVEQAGVMNLGSSSSTARDVSDKHAIGRRLAAAGLRVPTGSLGLASAFDMIAAHAEVVIKPNRGAGCVDTYVCRSAADIARLPPRTDWLVQERVHGLAASAAFVVPCDGPPIPLRAGIQAVGLSGDAGAGRLAYSGGRLPLAADLEQRAIKLGLAALRFLPGLRGLVGIDLVLGATPDQDTLIEVNPRPTVAYAGLRRLARFSIPELILGTPVCIDWHAGIVRFEADGTAEMLH